MAEDLHRFRVIVKRGRGGGDALNSLTLRVFDILASNREEVERLCARRGTHIVTQDVRDQPMSELQRHAMHERLQRRRAAAGT